jgi:uncharacterized membrane protein YkvA (DUF1232 family)
MSPFAHSVRERARRLKIDALALGLAVRHPQTPWYAKLLVAGLVAYVVTPVDLVPDFIPVFGFIDDLIFVPIALGLAGKLVPGPVLADCRGRAEGMARSIRLSRAARLAAIALWLAVAVCGSIWLYSA